MFCTGPAPGLNHSQILSQMLAYPNNLISSVNLSNNALPYSFLVPHNTTFFNFAPVSFNDFRNPPPHILYPQNPCAPNSNKAQTSTNNQNSYCSSCYSQAPTNYFTPSQFLNGAPPVTTSTLLELLANQKIVPDRQMDSANSQAANLMKQFNNQAASASSQTSMEVLAKPTAASEVKVDRVAKCDSSSTGGKSDRKKEFSRTNGKKMNVPLRRYFHTNDYDNRDNRQNGHYQNRQSPNSNPSLKRKSGTGVPSNNNSRPCSPAGSTSSVNSAATNERPHKKPFLAPKKTEPIDNEDFTKDEVLTGSEFSTGPEGYAKWDNLSKEIYARYERNLQQDELLRRKIAVKDNLMRLLQTHAVLPYCQLFIVGSSLNGFGGNTSDMDLCLVVSPNEIDQKYEASNTLKYIQKTLRKFPYIQRLQFISAKVPILKFRDGQSGIEVDLNVNSIVGIRNTHMLSYYAKMDWRVQPLVLMVKEWASHNDINDAREATISSYSLVLMVIHYLQCGVEPCILPCLQKLYRNTFSPQVDVMSLNLEETLAPFESTNKLCLGELFIGFLNYFSNVFDYNTQAISVRMGCLVPKLRVVYQNSRNNSPAQWKCLCIEEPFNLSNTARSCYNELIFEHVKQVFRTSWHILKQKRRISSIMPES